MFEQLVPSEVVPFREVRDGVFLLKRPSIKFPGEHYGVLIAGGPLGFFGIPSNQPVVIQRTEQIQAEWADTTGNWDLVDEVPPDQIAPALARASKVFADPNYYLLTNNCEHTARYIIYGEKKSTQVNGWVTAGVATAALIWLFNQGDN
jgi:hypothetical protein